MSDSIFNLRILSWHFKVSKRPMPSISYNGVHKANGWRGGRVALYQPEWFK